ncbi:MAG: helix-turn-helix domain-containing protein [Chloroflexota bacterium]
MALPQSAFVAGGGSGLGREVAWARVVRAQPPAFEGLEEGDLALLSLELMGVVDGLLSPQLVIHELAQLRVAALAVVGEAPLEMCAVADAEGLPLLILPTEANLREVEKAIIRLVLNSRAELEQRGVQMYRQLAQCITAGKGIDAIISTLGQITGKTVVLQDHSLRSKFKASLPGVIPTADAVDALLAASGWQGEWPQGHALVSTAPPIAHFSLLDQGIGRYSSPVIVYDYIVGYVSVLGPEEELNDIDRVAVGRAASVCALEMTKEHAVVEAENRTRGELVDSLLANDNLGDEALAERAGSLGFDLAAPVVALVFGYDRAARAGGGSAATSRGVASVLREEIVTREPAALLKTRESSVVALLPQAGAYPSGNGRAAEGEGAADSERIRRLAEQIRQHALRRVGGALSVGVGRPGSGVSGIRKSFREAEQALSIAQRLLGGNRATSFDELRIYRLLLPLVGSGELRSFSQEVLGRLQDYDAKHSGELIRTLEVFFAGDGNLQRAADNLFLHRNTLAYRLERIEEIAGVSLRDPDDRLCLQLALKIKDLD